MDSSNLRAGLWRCDNTRYLDRGDPPGCWPDATKVDGIPEVVLHQETGLLVEAKNSAALAEATSFLFAHQEKATTMGDTARLLAVKKFNMEHFVDLYQALYQQLTLEKSA